LQNAVLIYDNKNNLARDFYASIQNKFHYAITKNTAAEIIYDRVDSKKDNMGLTNWKVKHQGEDVITSSPINHHKQIQHLIQFIFQPF